MTTTTPTHGSLFTGYGGLDLAIEEVFGARTVWNSDIEPGPRKVLAHRFPGVPNLGDIPQRALLTAIGDGRTVQAHPKPWARLHALLLLDDGALAPLGEAVLWAVKP